MRMFEHLNNTELLNEYNSYDDMIHGKNSCYGVKDVRIFYELERECNLREESP